MSWALAKVQDRSGNYWTIAYDENTAEGEHYPRQISYTGSSTLVPYAAIRFVYEPSRPDPEVNYVAGSKLSTLRRLTRVQTFVDIAADGSGGSLAREYRVAYTASSESGRSLVSTIQDCDGAGLCLPPTSFAWQQQQPSERNFNAPGSGVWGGPVAVFEAPNGYPRKNVFRSVAMVDLDGDGKSDMLKSFETGTWQACLSTGSGFNCQSWAGPALKLRDVVLGDFNGDGRADLLHSGTGGPLQACLSTGTGFNCIAWPGLTSPAALTAAGYLVADFNGDGRDDLGGSSFCYSTGAGFDCRAFTLYPGDISQIDPICPEEQIRRRHLAGDFNDDGRTDYLVMQQWSAQCPPAFATHNYAWQLYTAVDDASGRGFVLTNPAPGLPNVDLNSGEVSAIGAGNLGAINSDAYSDLVLQGLSGGVLKICRSSGKGFACSTPTTGTGASHNIADVDGDGRPDSLVAIDSQTVRVCQLDTAAMSCVDWAGGMKTDLAGRGLLGFRWLESTEQTSRVTTRTEFAQAWPYTGMVQRQTSTHASGAVLDQIDNTLSLKTGCTGSGQMPFVSAAAVATNDLNGAALAQTATTTQMDCFGNPTSVSTSISAGGETYTTTIANTFDNTASSWRIGELRCSRITKTAPGVASVTRTVGIDYDGFGRSLRETVEPKRGTAVCATSDTINDYEVKAEYTRDAHGNVATKTLNWTEGTNTAKSRKVEDNTYEPKGRFPQTVKNALGHAETRVYSDALGTLTSLTGPNALTTTWQYDGWGRRMNEIRADSTFTTWAYRQCQSGCNGGTLASITTPSNGVPSVVYTDVLQREVRHQTWGFNGTEVLSDREHDGAGRLRRVALKRFAAEAPVWTSFDRDDLGRVWRTSDADGVSTVSFNGLETTFSNAKSQTRRELRNGLDKLRQVIDHNNQAVTYRYEPWGNLERVTDPKLNKVVVGYDRLGRKTSLSDPDLGLWSYKFNPLGELIEQVDPVRRALSQKTTFGYDALGRMTTRTEPDASATWSYDSCAKGVGKLCQATGANNYLRRLGYDSLGRLASDSVDLDGTYLSAYGYDAQGRLASATHTRAALNGSTGPAQSFGYLYNGIGYLKEIRSGAGASYWKVEQRDAFDRVKRAVLGNGVVVRRSFNANTTRLANAYAGANDSAGVQNDGYGYDALGNVESRSFLDAAGTLLSESFGYDALNRLASSTLGANSKSYTYDELGNLKSKTGVGSYAYPASGDASVRPHALSSVSGSVNGVINPSFGYDGNGNLTSGAGRTWSWTAANLPQDITQGSLKASFLYGPERQRIKQTLGSGAGTLKTIHYAGAMEKEVAGGMTSVRTYLPNGLGVVIDEGGTSKVRYFHKDRLGSVIAITDEAGSVLERLSYDAWGKRRNADGSDAGTNLSSNIADIGYTGHEMLDDFGLVHMNGRVYDPGLGRMSRADPYVPDAQELQAFNRYSYVANNPLLADDPSGFWPRSAGVDRYKRMVTDRMNAVSGLLVLDGCRVYCDVYYPNGIDPSQHTRIELARLERLGVSFKAHVHLPSNWQQGMPRDQYPVIATLACSDCGLESLERVEVIGSRASGLSDWLDRAGDAAHGFSDRYWMVPGGLVGLPLGDALKDFSRIFAGQANAWDYAVVGLGVAVPAARGATGLAAKGLAKPSAHSVVFETTIAKTGAGTREAHKALANRDLAVAMSDKEVAHMLSSMNVKPVGGAGTPAGFRWHHAPDRPGVMQLVPEAQHTPGSMFQDVLHPGGSGGFAQWGRGW